MTTEKTQLTNHIASLQSDNRFLAEQISQLKNTVKAAQSKVQVAQGQQTALSELQNDKEQLARTLADLRSENTNLAMQMANLQQNLTAAEEAKHQHASMQPKLAQLSGDYQSLQATFKATQQQLMDLQGNEANLKSTIERLSNQNSQQSTQISSLQEALTSTQAMADQLVDSRIFSPNWQH